MESIQITIASNIETIAIDNGTTTNLVEISTGEAIEIKESGAQGIQGPVGLSGPVGDTGPAGQDGVIGSDGADSTVMGPTGDIGPQGEQGIQGNTGADSTIQGPKGDDGAQGIQGIQGDVGGDSTVAGPQGVQGNAGADGIKGNDGADSIIAGPQGIQGVKGDTGADSIVAGPSGADSIVAGPQGEQGIQGPAGNDSVIAGPKGDAGADSTVAGPQGPQGEAGTGGGSVYSFNKITGTGTQSITSALAAIVFDQSVDSYGADVAYSAGSPTGFTVQTTGIYKWGAVVTEFSAAQRSQSGCKILIDGVESGLIRGTSYIRNSGTSWDYWPIELSSTPISLAAGEFVELAVGGVVGGAYGFSGTVSHVCHIDKTEFWLERMV